jgi:repressor of nif and glnA expression
MTENVFREEREIRMVQGAGSEVERKVVAILKVLSESSDPLGSITIARELERYGIYLSERAVRYHLRITDERGYTQAMGRDGRMLTSNGVGELRMALAPDQVGFIQDKLEMLAFRTTFDPVTKTGLVPVNTSIMDKSVFERVLEVIREVFKIGLAVSDLVKVAQEGEKLGSIVIPRGKVGLATVCSVVVNGTLLKAGIPMESRFGGVLEVNRLVARRFVALISYAGTSLDPSEQYVRAKMTSVGDVVRTQNGKILANFREVPAPARSLVVERINQLKTAGINGVFVIGNTSEPVCQISVGLNRVGLVLLGGLNPMAAAVEAGIEIENLAESGLLEYNQMQSVWNL